MGIGKTQALSSQPIQVGCRYSAVAVESANIAIPHVIGEDNHNVRTERLIPLRTNLIRCNNRHEHQTANQLAEIHSDGDLPGDQRPLPNQQSDLRCFPDITIFTQLNLQSPGGAVEWFGLTSRSRVWLWQMSVAVLPDNVWP